MNRMNDRLATGRASKTRRLLCNPIPRPNGLVRKLRLSRLDDFGFDVCSRDLDPLLFLFIAKNACGAN